MIEDKIMGDNVKIVRADSSTDDDFINKVMSVLSQASINDDDDDEENLDSITTSIHDNNGDESESYDSDDIVRDESTIDLTKPKKKVVNEDISDKSRKRRIDLKSNEAMDIPKKKKKHLSDTEMLQLECSKRAYLDGVFFVPDIDNIEGDIIPGRCQLCTNNKVIRGSLKYPSNYTKHLKNFHENKMVEYNDHVKKKRDENRQENPSTSNVSVQKQYEENISSLLMASSIPFSVVEMPEFKKLIGDLPLEGKLKIKTRSRRTICRRIRHLYRDRKQSIKQMLKQIPYVSTSVDMWSNSSHRFMGVCVNWLDLKTFMPCTAAIACSRFSGEHSFDRVAAKLQEIHDDYGLNSDKIVATVTDNASNLVKAFREFGVLPSIFSNEDGRESTQDNSEDCENSSDVTTESDDEEESLDACDPCEPMEMEDLYPLLPSHFRCTSHTLNLLATTDFSACLKTLKSLNLIHKEAIARCNILWKLMAYPKQKEKVISALEKPLLRPTVTRWNSLYDAISQIVELQDEIMDMIKKESIKSSLRESDFQYLKEYVILMKPIAVTLDKLQGNITYGYLLASLISLRNDFRDIVTQKKLQLCSKLLQKMQAKLETRFHQFFNLEGEGEYAAIAAFVHPAIKGKWLECFDNTQQIKIKKIVLQAMMDQHHPIDNSEPEQEDNSFNYGPSVSGNVVGLLFGEITPSSELVNFLRDPRTDLLVLNSYPIVREVFVKFNTPTPSSASVERLFSYAKMTELPQYNKLSPENFEKRVISRANKGNKFFNDRNRKSS